MAEHSEHPTVTSDLDIVFEVLPERVAHHFPVTKEPRINTLAPPVIIESACPGWQSKSQLPCVPVSIEDQVQELIDSFRAGAVACHVHPRDPKTGIAQVNPDLLKEVMDGFLEEVGDVVTLNHTWMPAREVDYVTETAKLLEMGGGNKYCQGSVVLPIGYTSITGAFHSERAVCEGVKWLEANNVKPIYQLYDTFSHFAIKQHVYDNGYSTDPIPVFNLHMGKHSSHAVHQDPWSRLNLIANYNTVQATFPGGIIGIYPGGRNWIPIMVEGLLQGAQLVRVGIEDCYWMYPHRDDVIQKNSDTVKLAVDICNLLGRRVVTDPDEARQIMGMKLTS